MGDDNDEEKEEEEEEEESYQGPQLAQMTANQRMHLYAFQQQLQAAAVAARYGQTPQPQGIMSNGTPANRSPMVQNTQLAGNVARPSPLSGNTPQTLRSPMPPAQRPGVVGVQPAAVPQQPVTVQPQQPPQQTQPTTVPIQAPAQPQGAHPQYPVAFQPRIPPVNFLNQPPGFAKKVSGNCSTLTFMFITGYQGPRPAQMTANQQMHLYAYQQQQLQAADRKSVV